MIIIIIICLIAYVLFTLYEKRHIITVRIFIEANKDPIQIICTIII